MVPIKQLSRTCYTGVWGVSLLSHREATASRTTESPSGVGLGGRRKQSSLAFPGAREVGGMTDPHDGSLLSQPVLVAGSTPACDLAPFVEHPTT